MISRRVFGSSLLAAGRAYRMAGESQAAKHGNRPPNFVILLADDLGYGDLGCYGNRNFTTPRLDRMAAEGVRLSEFYAFPTCTPARAALLTGRYPIRSGLVRVLIPREHFGIPDSEITLAQALKTKGYRTACIGKWHLGDLPPYRPNRHGFDYFYGLLYSNDMKLGHLNFPALRLYRNNEIVESPVHQPTLTRRYTEQAIQFIGEDPDRPFLLYLPYTMPHLPLSASEAFRGKSHYSLYGDAVQEIDWSVGRLLDFLKEKGLDENTLVAFTSDNGPVLHTREPAGSAGILRGGKSTTWEGGVRVPCVVRWPSRIPAEGVKPGITCLMDLFSTCVDLAGAELPAGRPIDGENLMPMLAEGATAPHSDFFYYFGRDLCAVRSQDWKLHMMKRVDRDAKKPGPLEKCPPELYNLKDDPGERRDLSLQYPSIIETLRGIADEFREAVQAGKLPKSHWRSLMPRLHHKA